MIRYLIAFEGGQIRTDRAKGKSGSRKLKQIQEASMQFPKSFGYNYDKEKEKIHYRNIY